MTRIELELTRSAAGRLTGTIRPDGAVGAEVAFSGTLELVAGLETILDRELTPRPTNPN